MLNSNSNKINDRILPLFVGDRASLTYSGEICQLTIQGVVTEEENIAFGDLIGRFSPLKKTANSYSVNLDEDEENIINDAFPELNKNVIGERNRK